MSLSAISKCLWLLCWACNEDSFSPCSLSSFASTLVDPGAPGKVQTSVSDTAPPSLTGWLGHLGQSDSASLTRSLLTCKAGIRFLCRVKGKRNCVGKRTAPVPMNGTEERLRKHRPRKVTLPRRKRWELLLRKARRPVSGAANQVLSSFSTELTTRLGGKWNNEIFKPNI